MCACTCEKALFCRHALPDGALPRGGMRRLPHPRPNEVPFCLAETACGKWEKIKKRICPGGGMAGPGGGIAEIFGGEKSFFGEMASEGAAAWSRWQEQQQAQKWARGRGAGGRGRKGALKEEKREI